LAESLPYPRREEEDTFLVQMISTCLPLHQPPWPPPPCFLGVGGYTFAEALYLNSVIKRVTIKTLLVSKPSPRHEADFKTKIFVLHPIFSLVRQKKPAKNSAVEEEKEQAVKLKKQAIFPVAINPGENFVTHKRPRYSRFKKNKIVKLVDKIQNLRAKVEDGGYKRMLRMVAHMEMFLKYIKPVLFLLFFAGPKLFHKVTLSCIFTYLF
jgi:hypothetical protein